MPRHVGVLFILCLGLLACSRSGFNQSLAESTEASQSVPETGTPEEPSPFEFQALSWEPIRAGSKAWSAFVFELISTDAQALLEAQDFDLFCPRYSRLNWNQKINAAGMLVSAMARYESNYNPVTRFQETDQGTDAITGQPVWSEGLMQLSYQDMLGYSFCEFDWNADRNLAVNDPQKTILDPYRNLDCGIRILARQVQRRGLIAIGSGAYWAVIKTSYAKNKIKEIADLVQTLDFCKPTGP